MKRRSQFLKTSYIHNGSFLSLVSFWGEERTGKPRDVIRENRDRLSDSTRWNFQGTGSF